MADFARRPNPMWAKVNLESSVVSFKLSRSRVCDASGRLRYPALGRPRAEEPNDVVRQRSGESFAHYFRTTNGTPLGRSVAIRHAGETCELHPWCDPQARAVEACIFS